MLAQAGVHGHRGGHDATFDWYAQDRTGNVWYFREDTKTLRNGHVTSREGSWQAGVRGAEPGIVMEAHPQVGDSYRQEFDAGHAQDRAEVLSTRATATIPLGTFHDLVKTKDTSPLEPAVIEHKYFAHGIGSIREVDVRGGNDQLELVSIRRSSLEPWRARRPASADSPGDRCALAHVAG